MIIIAGQGIRTHVRRVADQQKAAVVTAGRNPAGDKAGIAQILIGDQCSEIGRRRCHGTDIAVDRVGAEQLAALARLAIEADRAVIYVDDPANMIGWSSGISETK